MNRISYFKTISSTQKLHLDVQMGEHSIDPSANRTRDNLETLESSLQHLREQMVFITRQQEYHRVRFTHFSLYKAYPLFDRLWCITKHQQDKRQLGMNFR